MRIDSHQHFWIYDVKEYGWITDEMRALQTDFLPEQLAPIIAAAGFDGTIAVQARQTLEETEWLLELADRHPFVKGVVGWVDLLSPKVGDQLERLARHPKWKGVRHSLQDEPDDSFMLRDDFLRGIAALQPYGLVYDVLIYHRHLPNAVELVARFPEQRFVLDHIAKPDIRGGERSEWERNIRRLARHEHVYCKLSGMVTEADWHGWKPSDFKAYLDVVFDAFGANRLMIGSDWPVCTLSADYERVVGIVKDYLSSYPKSQQEQVLGRNAAYIYGVEG